MKKEIMTSNAPRPGGPYSQAVIVGNQIFVAGQGPIHHESGELIGITIEEQTSATLENVKAILFEAGATMDHIVKSTVHLSDMRNFDEFNKVYEM
jgi:2-iminobutanoate/2-iminopropanoate deaminase